MKHVFVDTNVYLSFYHYSGDDLNRLRAISTFIDSKQIKLYVNKQLKDEFLRNREDKLNDAIGSFIVPSVRIPRVFDQYPTERKAFNETVSQLRTQHKELIEKYRTDLNDDTLTADNLINTLLSEAIELDEEIFLKAKRRLDLGNPPGKKGSLGDALHWEYLLENTPKNTEIVIVSADRDWSSVLTAGKLNDFLLKEWQEKNGGDAKLYQNMSDYFKHEFPDIKLEGEFRKDLLIERLGSSVSFDETRSILRKLSLLEGDFSDEQISKILRAAISNPQVYRAHEYSPVTVGRRLWRFIGGKTVYATQEEWERFNELFTFPDEDFVDPLDLEEIPF